MDGFSNVSVIESNGVIETNGPMHQPVIQTTSLGHEQWFGIKKKIPVGFSDPAYTKCEQIKAANRIKYLIVINRIVVRS